MTAREVLRTARLLIAAAVAAMAATGCAPPSGLTIHNLADRPATIVLLNPDGDHEAIATVAAGSTTTLDGVDGCSDAGMQARDPDGEVLATLPPLTGDEFDTSEPDCDFTWLVTADGGAIDQR